MNLQELKTMIAEEFASFNEQEVAVSDADVDVTGEDGGDAEAQLKEIYEMLKSYFEGSDEEGGVEAPDDMDVDMDADIDTMEDEEDGAEALQERFKKLANIIKG